MGWIKRNLYFLIGALVALLFMGLAGWYLYANWQLNNQVLEKLNLDYAELTSLNQQNPHPGAGEVDNIKAAKEQQQQLRDFIQKSRKYFLRIPPIPDLAKVADSDLSFALSDTIARMRREATNASVGLQSDYNFSFQAQKNKVSFAPGSADLLAVQLGEVKAICDVLFHAKINSLDNLQRERVSTDDNAGNQTDYLAEKSVTNELAVLTPYALSFRCFSPELASVLAGFATSPYGLRVKAVNVEPAPAAAVAPTEVAAAPFAAPIAVAPPPPPPVPAAESPDAAFRRRYGIGPAAPPPQQPVFTAPMPVAPRPSALPIVLDEKQLKVTLLLDVVKLAAPKQEKEGRITKAEVRKPNE
jgi:hypothetical protein